jgi:hypothetical protein
MGEKCAMTHVCSNRKKIVSTSACAPSGAVLGGFYGAKCFQGRRASLIHEREREREREENTQDPQCLYSRHAAESAHRSWASTAAADAAAPVYLPLQAISVSPGCVDNWAAAPAARAFGDPPLFRCVGDRERTGHFAQVCPPPAQNLFPVLYSFSIVLPHCGQLCGCSPAGGQPSRKAHQCYLPIVESSYYLLPRPVVRRWASKKESKRERERAH